MSVDNRAIGVFDSGLGGISVLKELQQQLPHENFVYFGDTGRVPYGTRSRQTIVKYAMQDIRFLLSKNVKMIIAACGTASANLTPEYLEGLDVPFCNILLPAAQAACSASQTGRIGVIATPATIKSGAYGKAMRNIRPNAVVVGSACPLFVPLVENGFIERGNPVTRMVAEQYLAPFQNGEVDVLILGCTHYPIISETISDVLNGRLPLINPGVETAKQASALLVKNNLLRSGSEPGHTEFYVSDNPESFGEIASLFLGETVTADVKLVDLDSFIADMGNSGAVPS